MPRKPPLPVHNPSCETPAWEGHSQPSRYAVLRVSVLARDVKLSAQLAEDEPKKVPAP